MRATWSAPSTSGTNTVKTPLVLVVGIRAHRVLRIVREHLGVPRDRIPQRLLEQRIAGTVAELEPHTGARRLLDVGRPERHAHVEALHGTPASSHRRRIG